MDLKQIEYILKIAEEQNITHAAEKLFCHFLELQSPSLPSTSSFSSWKKSSALRYSTVPGLTGTQPLPAKSISTQQKTFFL
ncbi:MAG: hypothetical protein ACLUAG_10095 [Lachnospiraceae bacterium]